MATVSADGPLALHFRDITRVAGETLQGRVDLNVQLAQEDNLEHLRIKFRGTIHTKITTSNGQSTIDHHQTVTLFHTKCPLWDQGTMYPAPGSHIISCPFEFKLPDALPPSFHCEAYHRRATVGYSLEVVGERAGFFRTNRRIRRIISIVPAATQSQLLVKESLRQSWNGKWTTYVRDQKLRRGIWGDYSQARVKITMPDLPSFPIATPIPFSFYVETDTKPMHDSDGAPVDKHGKPLFPAPPALSSDVLFHLLRSVDLRVRHRTRQVEDSYALFGSLGDPRYVAAVRQESNVPEWIPDPGHKYEKGRGFWRRSVKFESTVSIPYAPTFRTETVEWRYQLKFVLPFPGIGNDMRILLPIRLDPGSACPPPPIGAAGSSSTTYADVLPAGPPPPMLDLPPAYWAGDHHDWDTDDKKSE